jgi:hypothetical protein
MMPDEVVPGDWPFVLRSLLFVVIDKSRCASRLAGGSRGGMRHHSYNRGASLVVYAT